MSNPENLKNKQWQLTALSEALGDLTLTVEDTISIGRGKDNEVVLGSKQVSRQHAELKVDNGALYVKDLGSSNGTLINDNKIPAHVAHALADEDVVSFAVFKFKVSKLAQESQSTVIEPQNASEQSQPVEQSPQTQPTPKIDEDKLEEELERELEEPISIGDPNQNEYDKPVLPESSDHNEALANEATPELHRAKQAATTKLSGTANLVEDIKETDITETDVKENAEKHLEAKNASLVEPEKSLEPAPTVNEANNDKNKDNLIKSDVAQTLAPQSKEAETKVAHVETPNNTAGEQQPTLNEPHPTAEEAPRNVAHVPKSMVTSEAKKNNNQSGSGSGLLWLVLIIVILAIAIWLFNSGM